jgi:hypothetical protein
MHFKSCTDFRFISTLGGGKPSKMGTLDGNGNRWWWWPFFGYV